MSIKTTPLSADLRDIAHVTPIACPACRTGKAALSERRMDGLERDGKSEIWVFTCNECEAVTVQPVER
jgi:hypothetical protein